MSFELKLSRVVPGCFLYVQNKIYACWVKTVSGTGFSRKSFKNGRCRRQKQNCDKTCSVLCLIVDANQYKKSLGYLSPFTPCTGLYALQKLHEFSALP
jgi:hypothetical protein